MILHCPIKHGELVEHPKTGQMVDDNILYQFQRLFAFLEMSDRKTYESSDFCFSFKDYDGQPVNTALQQDV